MSSRVLSGIAGLSGASAASRVISAVSILLLAFWLSPAEFGYWAAATSSMAIAMAFVNFGEVNGYLSGHGGNFTSTRRSTFRGNLVLTAVALAIAGMYFLAGNATVGTLAVLIAVTVPLVGDSDLLYGAGVKHQLYLRVTVSQVAAAALKLGVGVAIAAWTGSAIAIAIATLAYYVVAELVLLWRVPRVARSAEPEEVVHPPTRTRAKWAVNSVFMTLPVQSVFLVAQFIASPELLGIFYLAFQASLAVSGVLVAPLSKVTLATFASTAQSGRAETAYRIAAVVGALLMVIAPTLQLVSPAIDTILAAEWQLALPAAVILLASLPMRIMGPILDSYQQSANRWWQSTAFNIADTVMTALASLMALTGDVLLLATSIAVSKMLLGAVRTIWVFADQHLLVWLLLVLPVSVGGAAAIAAVFVPSPASQILCATSLAIAAAWALTSMPTGRPSILRVAFPRPPAA